MGDDTVDSAWLLVPRFVHPVGKSGTRAYSPASASLQTTTPFLRIYKKEKRRVAALPSSEPTDKPLLAVLRGERRDPPPIWMMRQAGRYLPEYRELRAAKGGFLSMVYDAESAAEITLQPLRRFPLDAAILFSDILIVPHALGMNLSFVAGEGPRLAPPLVDAALDGLQGMPQHLEAIYATVRRVKAGLAPQTTFLGFAGSPWTVATYMVAGEGSREQAEARTLAYQDPGRFGAIIAAIEDLTFTYLIGQADAGVDAVQLFDSWSGSLAPAEFERWVIAPTARIVERLRSARPQLSIIGFPKGAGGKLPAYARETGVDALGLDETVDPAWADLVLPKGLPVQGNLDPLALIAGGAALEQSVKRILNALADRPHVFNLGHGIQQTTPIAHVEHLLRLLGKTL
jgi:uroporphyrinogen decarboxylase